MSSDRSFVPALGLHALTGLYDGLLARFLAEDEWKARLVEVVAPAPGNAILDLGCGTGTLALRLKRACPGASLIGIDPDPVQLERARAKAAGEGVAIRWERAFADALPLAEASVDIVVSSLVLHHLRAEAKRAALREARRVLRPGGRILIADWADPDDVVMKLAYLPVQILDGFANTNDNLQGLLPAMMREAGFDGVREIHRRRTGFGNLAVLQAGKPDGSAT